MVEARKRETVHVPLGNPEASTALEVPSEKKRVSSSKPAEPICEQRFQQAGSLPGQERRNRSRGGVSVTTSLSGRDADMASFLMPRSDMSLENLMVNRTKAE